MDTCSFSWTDTLPEVRESPRAWTGYEQSHSYVASLQPNASGL
jgi:hypothetical protein